MKISAPHGLFLGWLMLWVGVTSCSRSSETHLFRYAHSQPEAALRSESMRHFKKIVEERSQGRLQVELYFGGVLGTERELMDYVTMGVLQGTRGAFYRDANPQFQLFTLPFLVANWDEAIALIQSPFTAALNQKARERGFHIPATGISQGFRAHTNSQHPITHPDDLKGMNMRVPPQAMYVKTAEAFGANPQEIPAIEIYQALKTGVVDGQDNPPSNIWDYHIHEVSKYVTVTHYSTGPDPFMVHLGWYESLPEDLREIFDQAARESMALSDQLNQDMEQQYLDRLGDHLEVNILNESQLQPFREAVGPVYEHFVAQGTFSWEDIHQAQQVARGEHPISSEPGSSKP